MTNRNPSNRGLGTPNVDSTSATGGYSWYGGGEAASSASASTKAARDFRNYMLVEPVTSVDANGRTITLPYVKSVTLTFHNLSGGLNRVWGIARQPSPYFPYSDLDRTSAESLDTSYLGAATLPLLSVAETAGDNGSVLATDAMCSCFALGALVVGIGSVANVSLMSTAVSPPVLNNHTYTPGSAINCLTYAVIGGTSSAKRLLVGKAGNPIDVISVLGTTPTSDGTMHANTNPCWGIVVSPLNATTPGASTLLIYANNNIYSLGSENAIGTAPTSALSNVPNGGYAVSSQPVEVPGVPFRAYWVWPSASAPHRSWQVGSSIVQGQLVSTNLEGTDPQIINLPIHVMWAVVWNNSIVVSDGLRIIKWEGVNGWFDLNIYAERAPNSDIRYQCFGLGVFKGDLYSYTVTNNITNTTATAALERYDMNPESWHQKSANITMTTFANTGGLGGTTWIYDWLRLWSPQIAGQIPFDQMASQVHMPKFAGVGGNFFFRKFITPPGSSTFFLYTNTSGSGATTGQQFETTGSVTSPSMLLEGLEGLPFVVEEVQGMMDVAAGGSDATVAIAIARQSMTDSTFNFTNNLSSTFSGTDPMSEMIDHDHYLDNRDFATRFQYKLTLTQGSGSTRKTSNGLPFRVKLLVFLDRKVRSPREVRG